MRNLSSTQSLPRPTPVCCSPEWTNDTLNNVTRVALSSDVQESNMI